jgi:hypothetical protein
VSHQWEGRMRSGGELAGAAVTERERESAREKEREYTDRKWVASRFNLLLYYLNFKILNFFYIYI